MRKHDRKLVLIIDPHIKREAGYFLHEDATEHGYYVKDKDGKDYESRYNTNVDKEGWCWPGSSSYLDFFDPAVSQYYADRYKFDNFPGTSKDVHFWNDMNEPSVFNGPEITMPKDCRHYKPAVDGQDGLAAFWEHRHVHNEYGLWQIRATQMGATQRTDGKYRSFILTRSTFAGTQRYAAVWTGDNAAEWGHLAASLPMCLSLAAAGVSHCGADVGGFFKYPEPELMTRWYQCVPTSDCIHTSLAAAGVSHCGADVGGFFKYPEPELMTRWYQVSPTPKPHVVYLHLTVYIRRWRRPESRTAAQTSAASSNTRARADDALVPGQSNSQTPCSVYLHLTVYIRRWRRPESHCGADVGSFFKYPEPELMTRWYQCVPTSDCLHTSLAAAGVSHCGADVGGFFKYPEPELMTRWYQAGAFQPFFRAHSHIETKRREPWLYEPATTALLRDATRRRYALIDFWYTLFYEHSQDGLPVMRPLWQEFPREQDTYTIDDQYLLGSSLLVRPVTEPGVTSVKVYLPGKDDNTLWYDVDSYRVHPALGYFNQEVTLSKIPVYQRGGTIIPRKERVRRSSALMADDPYTLVVALDANDIMSTAEITIVPRKERVRRSSALMADDPYTLVVALNNNVSTDIMSTAEITIVPRKERVRRSSALMADDPYTLVVALNNNVSTDIMSTAEITIVPRKERVRRSSALMADDPYTLVVALNNNERVRRSSALMADDPYTLVVALNNNVSTDIMSTAEITIVPRKERVRRSSALMADDPYTLVVALNNNVVRI
ncbi:glycosyl hydrolases family 31 domain-containing protein [Phthorimaea operculella]|nr:glycosyl hydrolases family 31 domain-containing protein [Phthorimaea operculella]